MTLPDRVYVPGLSGERFVVHYALSGVPNERDAAEKAADICLEQTVEFPADLLPPGDIPDQIVGHIESLTPGANGGYDAVISYPVEAAGTELTQLLNVVFGNSSIKPGIRVERMTLPESLLAVFRGPRFGRAGLRDLLGVYDRPLLCTAIKPLGLSPRELAEMAYQFALGGIDLIKDDHGLADQPFCPFQERAERCAEAVARANHETGLKCVYVANVTAPADKLVERARRAKTAGAGGLMVAPGLVGMDAIRCIADDASIALPILSHPAFLGSLVTSPENGIAHYALYGQLMRLAGADAAIFPNYGGRFASTYEECRQIAAGTQVEMGHMPTIFPAPGGGMSLDRLRDMSALYGRDVIYLIGGGLHRHGSNLTENARYFSQLVSQL
ncbi:MAG: ribulose 1,5-bisphosphate carboxylase large subunit [Anaerolineae bacterium]|nr:ribulose 1,5-bisphosphate carboxylase large subunit [Anaerolineae bacterium]